MGTSKGYLPPTGYLWSDAKRAVTAMARNNFQGSGIGRAVSKFADATMSGKSSASGGLNSFASSASSAIGFFDYVGQYGFNEALNKVGLQNLVGKSNEEIYIGLLDYFSGDGSSIEKNITRDSMSELLKEQFLDMNDEDDYDDIIANMDMNKFIKDFIIKFIQKSFLTNFSEKIEGLCKNLDEYVTAENNIKDFIKIEIDKKYTYEELSKVDWNGSEGKSFMNAKCEKAFEIFRIWKEDIDEDMD